MLDARPISVFRELSYVNITFNVAKKKHFHISIHSVIPVFYYLKVSVIRDGLKQSQALVHSVRSRVLGHFQIVLAQGNAEYQSSYVLFNKICK